MPWDVVYEVLDGREGALELLLKTMPDEPMLASEHSEQYGYTLTVTAIPSDIHAGLFPILWSFGHTSMNSGIKLKRALPFQVANGLEWKNAEGLKRRLRKFGVTSIIENSA